MSERAEVISVLLILIAITSEFVRFISSFFKSSLMCASCAVYEYFFACHLLKIESTDSQYYGFSGERGREN